MKGYYSEWDDYEYELSLCRNYRELKNYIENQATESWPWFRIRNDYLNQIKQFSKINLAEYHPDKNLDDFLEKYDEPFPIFNPYFFSHLPIQLAFFKLNRIKNLLDYHFYSYLKYFPEYEEAFLKAVQGNVVKVVEHNQITDYELKVVEILEWVRAKNEFLQNAKRNQIFIKVVTNQFFDLSVNNYNNIVTYINHTVEHPRTKESTMEEQIQKEKLPKKKVPKANPGEKIVIKPALEEEFIRAIYEFVNSDFSDNNLRQFKNWFRKIATGAKNDKQYVIKSKLLLKFCRKIREFYDRKKAFLSPTKNILAAWIVSNFSKNTEKGPAPIPYITVYSILKGSKK